MKKLIFNNIAVFIISISYIIEGVCSLYQYTITHNEKLLNVGYGFTIIGVAVLSAFLMIKLKRKNMINNPIDNSKPDIELDGRYGLDGQYIYFKPNMIDYSTPITGDVITNRKGNIKLYCIEDGVYKLWNNESRDFITGYDLYLGYKKI